MHITTCHNNTYSYLRRTGEIVSGIMNDNDFVWNFEPLKPFNEMPNINMYILSVTEQCNLRCTYCCYSGKYESNRTHSSHSMSIDDIYEIYDFIDRTSEKRPIRIAFYGGEPLVVKDKVMTAITEGRERWGDGVDFSITTNGTLLNKEMIDWLLQNDVEIAVSIDGTQKFHDMHRVDRNGKGSFGSVYKALSYIKSHCNDFNSNVRLSMTIQSFDFLEEIAESWNNNSVLHDIAPSSVNAVSPNFDIGVEVCDYEQLRIRYTHLLDLYEQHQDWLVLKVFFDQCIDYWINRPIVDASGMIPMATCMPINTKLYIDSYNNIGVCEKMSDNYRIGTVKDGIDWQKANKLVYDYYQKRKKRCAHCPAIRVCELCLKTIEFSPSQWDVLCERERIYARLYMFVFCEMAERGMIR